MVETEVFDCLPFTRVTCDFSSDEFVTPTAGAEEVVKACDHYTVHLQRTLLTEITHLSWQWTWCVPGQRPPWGVGRSWVVYEKEEPHRSRSSYVDQRTSYQFDFEREVVIAHATVLSLAVLMMKKMMMMLMRY